MPKAALTPSARPDERDDQPRGRRDRQAEDRHGDVRTIAEPPAPKRCPRGSMRRWRERMRTRGPPRRTEAASGGTGMFTRAELGGRSAGSSGSPATPAAAHALTREAGPGATVRHRRATASNADSDGRIIGARPPGRVVPARGLQPVVRAAGVLRPLPVSRIATSSSGPITPRRRACSAAAYVTPPAVSTKIPSVDASVRIAARGALVGDGLHRAVAGPRELERVPTVGWRADRERADDGVGSLDRRDVVVTGGERVRHRCTARLGADEPDPARLDEPDSREPLKPRASFVNSAPRRSARRPRRANASPGPRRSRTRASGRPPRRTGGD